MTRYLKKVKVNGKPYKQYKICIVDNRPVYVHIYDYFDLMELSDRFKKNRKFDTWKEVFYESLKKKKTRSKESYETGAKRTALKIVRTFIDLVFQDIIEENVEFSFNRPRIEKNKISLRMGYIINPGGRSYTKKDVTFFQFAGVFYTFRLHYPMKKGYIPVKRLARIGVDYRKNIYQMLKKGKRYYNSTEEKILSQL